MGVDTRLYLYRSADPQEVASAMAILSGNDPNPHWVPRSGRDIGPEPSLSPGARSTRGFWVPRPKVQLKAADFSFGVGTIDFLSPVDRLSKSHHTTIHHTNEHGFGWTLIPSSTPYWIALLRRIVDIFGGALDYNDSDATENDYFRFERGANPIGDAYLDRQDEILALKPLTPGEIEACRGFAAYSDVGSYFPGAGDAATA